MSVVEVLHELGGVATRGTLLRLVSRADLDRAVEVGDAVRLARGRYALAGVDAARAAAMRLSGVLGLTSAALEHGWAVKAVPTRPCVVLSRGRRVTDRRVVLLRAELGPGDVLGSATSPELTLEHCLRRLPFDEALTVADSALRAGVDRAVLERLAVDARGPGSTQVKRVAREASPLAANPFESVLRAIALDVAGLAVAPQVTVREPGLVVRPDLVDQRRRIVIEADSFEWHGGRSALASDARRYDLLVVHGWVVLRFAYEHVMGEPAFVREVLEAAVRLTDGMKEADDARPSAA